MAEKITKKDLKQPDWLHEKFAEAMNNIEENRVKIYWGTGIFLLVILTIAGWSVYRNHYEKSAEKLYAQAFAAATEEKKPGEAADIIRLYDRIVKEYPYSDAALLAYYRLGNLYYKVNQIDAAIESYDALLRKVPENSDIQTLASVGLGYCYERKKDLDKALEAFEKAARTPQARAFESMNYGNIARIYEEMNNQPKALEYYRKALEKSHDPSMSLFIKRKIGMLS
ncbi:MAG: tetratricopeptide repeat protein [Deltaproteobacteria bacterium]|nr:tetratricopeptide repeat protein [Deltaproteobacteria bacterium]